MNATPLVCPSANKLLLFIFSPKVINPKYYKQQADGALGETFDNYMNRAFAISWQGQF